MDEKIYWIALNLAGLSSIKFKKLFEETKDIKGIFELSISELIKLGIPKNVAKKIKKLERLPLDDEINFIKKEGINVLTLNDSAYPSLLKEIYDPPFLLYVKGNIDFKRPTISIVGTRTPSLYGLKMAEKFASELADNGFIIVSGLARGIDTSAHTGALKVEGKTIGVLGSGFRNFYPPENKKLEKEIIKNGAVITEFFSNTLPEKYNFPKRNRIVSGLSLATIVIEAGPRSGALITANFALEQGREVFALPGRVDTLYSRGTNKLLKEGAILVEDTRDIIETLNIEVKVKERKEISAVITEKEKIVLNILEQPVQLEEIVNKTQIQPNLLLQMLTQLQIKGIIEELPGKIYRKKGHF